jgi:hypothetical protein
MGNESGKSIIILLILTIFIVIGVGVSINYAQQMIVETKEQDLRTNMFLIQAEVKKGLEEVCFKTVNLDESKEENLSKVQEIKNQHLKGIKLSEAPIEVQEAIKDIPEVNFDENCYYLDEVTLNGMGIQDIYTSQYGYFIVKYDISNAGVEVINTKGINGKYTLTQIIETIDGGQS